MTQGQQYHQMAQDSHIRISE